MEKLDVISFGSSTRDVFVLVDNKYFGEKLAFLPGSKVEIKEMDFFTGGGATNTSVGFSRLGLHAGIVSAVGNDQDGIEIKKELLQEKVDCKNLISDKHACTSYSVILTGFGRDRVILNYAGATALLDHSKKINWSKVNAKWFFVSSLHGKGELLSKIFLHAKKIGARIGFNPGNKEIELGLKWLEKLALKPSVLLLNAKEAQKLTGFSDTKKNLNVLSEFAQVVAITDGEKQVVVFDGEKVYSKKPFNIKVVDTSGAGDAFNSGFVGALAKGKKIEEALDFGIANSNSVVQHLGTKNILLTESGVKSFL